MEKFAKFTRIAEVEFADIVLSTQDLGTKLRIYLNDTSFIDFSYTTRISAQRFFIHWERRHMDGFLYRLDNTPDKKWVNVETFPLHFHERKHTNVGIAPFSIEESIKLENLLRNFLRFARKKLLHVTK